VWGGLHGLFLCIEKLITGKRNENQVAQMEPAVEVRRASLVPAFMQGKRVNKLIVALFVFMLVNVTWVFFRAADFHTAWSILASMFGMSDKGVMLLPTIDIIVVSVVITALLITHHLMRNTTVLEVMQKANWRVMGLVWAFFVIMLLLSQKSGGSFIYFQF